VRGFDAEWCRQAFRGRRFGEGVAGVLSWACWEGAHAARHTSATRTEIGIRNDR
jgi:hypothetical protein